MQIKTVSDYVEAIASGKCVNCGKQITTWNKFCRIFWAPMLCNISTFWRVMCSHKCDIEYLERIIKEQQNGNRI